MPTEMILVGTGGQGAAWCHEFLPPHVEDGRVEVVAAVDVDTDAHGNAQDALDLAPDECYEDADAAFESHPEADWCAVVVPPWVHEEIVDLALAHDCDVLCEKPIADTLEGAVRIAEKVERAGKKMGITMTHRFDRDKTSLRDEIRGDASGPLDYLVGRFTCDARRHGDWGAFRHDIDDPLLVEGAVHQLDFLADMAGAPVETLYADTWRPEWAEYDGDCQALVQLRCENGARIAWEGAKANAAGLNGWGADYVRAECRDATLVLDDRELVRHEYDPESSKIVGATDERDGDPVPLQEGNRWGNELLIERFLDWRAGGDPMATNVRDNLQSVALVEAAIESSATGQAVRVQDLLADAEASVEV